MISRLLISIGIKPYIHCSVTYPKLSLAGTKMLFGDAKDTCDGKL